ncbi:alpha/beta fold hydrolase [Gloeobacter morelensis MG652769]|uniref:Alpha/beta fold hydrolase n=2 Tax=Gloeobacter TaxID=33071 RepID=A0ABY3PTN1_9CYAN|nr:alpha/beta fold hydrolase [Gloeobacter morelensis MG652769]
MIRLSKYALPIAVFLSPERHPSFRLSPCRGPWTGRIRNKSSRPTGVRMRADLKPASTAEAYWTWRGHRICYWVAEPEATPERPPIVLLHGFGASAGHWRKNIAELAAHRRVYALDWLGFGASAKPALPYSLELWEAQLVDFCAEVVAAPAVLIGNSIGALEALIVSAHHPERVTATVLINCAGGLTHRPEELPLVTRPVMAAMQMVLRMPGLAERFFDFARSKRNIRNTLRQVYGNAEAVTEELVELLYTPSTDPGAAAVFVSVLTAEAGPRPEALLPLVRTPLLVLWGDKDPWTPIGRGRTFTRYAPTARFVALEGLGHCPHDEDPQQVNAMIREWLKAVEGQAG